MFLLSARFQQGLKQERRKYEKRFLQDSKGRWVFFPFGAKGQGYILPSEDDKEKILDDLVASTERRILLAFGVGLVLFFVLRALCIGNSFCPAPNAHTNGIYFGLAFLIALLGTDALLKRGWLKERVASYRKSDLRPKENDLRYPVMEQMADRMRDRPKIYQILNFVGGLFLLFMGLAFIMSPKSPLPVGLLFLVLGGFLSFLTLNVLSASKKKEKTEKVQKKKSPFHPD